MLREIPVYVRDAFGGRAKIGVADSTSLDGLVALFERWGGYAVEGDLAGQFFVDGVGNVAGFEIIEVGGERANCPERAEPGRCARR